MELGEIIYKWLEDFSDPLKRWIMDNHQNPILWISLLAIGIGLFFVTYDALNKQK